LRLDGGAGDMGATQTGLDTEARLTNPMYDGEKGCIPL
jgi:hypothetical protein